ncbi:MAG: hypothetical protein IV104_10700 [Acidovorax sp.]|nr:hypothetical protein [Acidovorax sp.]
MSDEPQKARDLYAAMTEQEFEARELLAVQMLAPMIERHSQALALGVALVVGSSQVLATDADVEVRGALKNLGDGLHIFSERPTRETPSPQMASPETAFADLKRSAAKAFSESPTDAAILASSATPDLVRYLLAALRAYDGMPANLATALRAKNRVGATEVWDLRRVIVDAADEAFQKLKHTGTTRRESFKQAVEDVAYEKFVAAKRNKTRQEPKQEKKCRGEIRDLLNEYFGWE